ncbi:hypothetical protein DFQ28_006561 [Apophysomyces sp. BC1034]|nr:hypothetical protein DFQ30_006596 [Apophysomyces sp. BC1015]KAG0176843.1 hypothetical protein DFQ29_005571 [Apophysomyces sp. BC1021]KAG0187272.1 hypothetical protein DFQ28_006561 [Apophysomyces sp. BC1034]
MSIATFHGFIETTADTLLIFEACRRGILPKINRRLQDRERGAIQSGTVFVFDEKESGIKRWTDGLVWSPSRILGNFLIYRELDNRDGNQGRTDRRRSEDAEPERDYEDEDECTNMATTSTVIDRNRERALVGSLTNSYKFKQNGLIKKTMSIVLNGSSQHLISYYTKEDVLAHRLQTPSSIPALASLPIAPDLLLRQSFRIPPTLEQGADPFDKRHNASPSISTSSPMSNGSSTSIPMTVMHQTRRRRRNMSEEDQIVDVPRKLSRNSWDEAYARDGRSSSSMMVCPTGSGDQTWFDTRYEPHQLVQYPNYPNHIHDDSGNRNSRTLVTADAFATTSVPMQMPSTLPPPPSREAYYSRKAPELQQHSHFQPPQHPQQRKVSRTFQMSTYEEPQFHTSYSPLSFPEPYPTPSPLTLNTAHKLPPTMHYPIHRANELEYC